MNIDDLFLKIFKKADKPLIVDESCLFTESTADNTSINVSAIASFLINEAGRWCEGYSSDFLFTWDEVRKAIDSHIAGTNSDKDIFVFGFRRYGVDHDNYVFNRMRQFADVDEYYRKIYAVQVHSKQQKNGYRKIGVALKDIQTEVGLTQYHWKCEGIPSEFKEL